ncbi:hypothetical protein ACN47E_007060 [Coniothyrium glycines]
MRIKRKDKGTHGTSATTARSCKPGDISGTGIAGAASIRRTSSGTEGAKMHVSRLAPSVPFQMTTRRGAKTTSSHASPAGPSSASSGSRRSSLHDVARIDEDPSDLEDAQPAKRSRTLTDSGSPQRASAAHGHSIPESMNGTQTPELAQLRVDASPSTPKTTARKRRASDESMQSTKTMDARPNGLLTRTHSDMSEPQPRRKKRKTADTLADSLDLPPELTDASTAPNSPEPMPEVDGSQNLHNLLPTHGDAPAKAGRRLPGRRRQPHPDMNIEVDLRRQLNLKMSYRSLAKIQKALLDELSSRTITNLFRDAQFHAQCPEYGPLMALLDQRRDDRLDQLHAARTYRLEQLDRVRVAEERIQKEQYINRFRELQDDVLLQCYFRMKRIEREMKTFELGATDDEENVLPPTYTNELYCDKDDRVDSKYASRSRAYVEADKELEKEDVRRRLDLARSAYVDQNDDADDSMDDTLGGFAQFSGPDRIQAIAHYNLSSLANAANNVQRTPSLPRNVAKDYTVPNEHASMLMLLANLSAQQPRTIDTHSLRPDDRSIKHETNNPPQPMAHGNTTPAEPHPVWMSSPAGIPLTKPLDSLDGPAQSSPTKDTREAPDHNTEAAQLETDDATAAEETVGGTTKQMAPVRLSTHRIMDILNHDREVPVPRSRETQLPRPTSQNLSHHNGGSQHEFTSLNLDVSIEGSAKSEEPPVDQALMDALEIAAGAPAQARSSPAPQTRPWAKSMAVTSTDQEEALRRRDPLQKIRELLDKKAREHGREPPDRPQYWRGPSAFRSASTSGSYERLEGGSYDPLRPSTGLHGASPKTASTYSLGPRHESTDHSQGPQLWRDRQLSGSQATQQPAASLYQASASMAYKSEQQRPDPTPPAHQSPYAPPLGTISLPPKPPGPPPSGPINFRFAHYDPVPPRQSYPPASPSYPPASSPVHAPNQVHYNPTYAGTPLYQGGYVPPPGSFQAPPPPSSLPSYPPLKIHQYGGQPILPANMAPPQQVGTPITFVGQSSLPSVFSPTQGQPPTPHYEQRESTTERPAEPQSRPRRPYRSYHAPGTQFRSYQGPVERRRGG